MVERFLSQTSFTSQEDFIKNLKINVPENFNFGYDVVDAWAAEHPDKPALLWTNDKGEHIQFSFADMKRYTDMTASYFQSLGIGHGDMVMLILKRRYEFWFSIIALHKLGAVVIPATHLLTNKDIVYRCNAADIKMIVCAGESVITDHITAAMPDSPSVKKLVSVGPEIAEGFEDFHKGIADAAPFARPEHPNSNDDISLMYFTSGTTGEPKMVAHDFTYPLGHIVTGSFWHNLHENSLHLTIADTGWGKAVWTMDSRSQHLCIRSREIHSCRYSDKDTGLSRHLALRTAYHLPVPDSRRPDEVRPLFIAVLHHCRRSVEPRRIRYIQETDRHQPHGRFRTDRNHPYRSHHAVDAAQAGQHGIAQSPIRRRPDRP